VRNAHDENKGQCQGAGKTGHRTHRGEDFFLALRASGSQL
jgi:hypothetical protein